MKISSTFGLVILYFLVTVGVVSTTKEAFILISRPNVFSFIEGLALLILVVAFVLATTALIIKEYRHAKSENDKYRST